MTALRPLAAVLGLLIAAAAPLAQHATLEIPQATLNAVAGRIGRPSDVGTFYALPGRGSGKFQRCDLVSFFDCPSGLGRRPTLKCELTNPLRGRPPRGRGVPDYVLVPGDPAVTWQWWVEGAAFAVTPGALTLTATVRSRVGDATNTVTRTAPASIVFDAASNRLRIQVESFAVPLEHSGQTVTTVNVGRLYGLAVPLDPQSMTVPLPNGSTRTLNLRATGITTQFLAGRVAVNFNVAF